MRLVRIYLFAFLMLLFSVSCFASMDAGWNNLKQKLVSDGFNVDYINAVFAGKDIKYSADVMGRKIKRLVFLRNEPKKKKKVRESKFDERYISPIYLAGGYAYLREHYVLLKKVESVYQVSPEILTALLLVETRLGYTLGSEPAFLNLANMAATSTPDLFIKDISDKKLSKKDIDWIKKKTLQKSNWAYAELVSLLKFSAQNTINPAQIPGSPYGAFGICQFMPSTAIHYGVDGNNDKKVDLFLADDALFSMANFLKKHGWKKGLTKDQQLKIIYRYNHSKVYARTIHEVARQLLIIRKSFGPQS